MAPYRNQRAAALPARLSRSWLLTSAADTSLFAPAMASEADSVVLVEVRENTWLIGFVTARKVAESLFPDCDERMIGVYMPMSYQIGGYTLYIEARKVKPLDISVEDGMRIALTGGMQRGGRR